MRIGIDISQIAYQNTGVANFTKHLVEHLLKIDHKNEYVLFFSSLRRNFDRSQIDFHGRRIKVKAFKFPPIFLDFLWNNLHVVPIEWFIGDVDIFISSDWTQPPTIKAKKVTILYDLIVYMHPNETDRKIVATQKKRLSWITREAAKVLCISDATRRDALRILNISENKLDVVYPGI